MADLTLTRKAEDLAKSMIDYAKASGSPITDFNEAAVARAILEAAAMEIEEQSYRAVVLVNRAIQESVYTPFSFHRLPAQPAVAPVTFSRSTAAGEDYPIAAGSLVQSPATSLLPAVQYRVQATVTLLTGTTSIEASVECVSAGLAGNCDAGAISELVTTINGIEAVTNANRVATGREEESDSARKARFQKYVDALRRATAGSLEYAAGAANPTVFEALAIEDPDVTVLVETTVGVFVDRSTAARDPDDTVVALFGEPPVTSTALYLGCRDLFPGVNFHLFQGSIGITGIWEYWDGSAWSEITIADDDLADATEGLGNSGTVRYTVPTDWQPATVNGFLLFWLRRRVTGSSTPVVPTLEFVSVPPGRGYVDLVVHDGTGVLPAAMKTDVENLLDDYRACGVRVTVVAPTIKTIAVTVELTIDPDMIVDQAGVLTDAATALENFLNQQRLGADVVLAELHQILMGVNDDAITNAVITLPAEDIMIAPRQIARAGTITVTQADVP